MKVTLGSGGVQLACKVDRHCAAAYKCVFGGANAKEPLGPKKTARSAASPVTDTTTTGADVRSWSAAAAVISGDWARVGQRCRVEIKLCDRMAGPSE